MHTRTSGFILGQTVVAAEDHNADPGLWVDEGQFGTVACFAPGSDVRWYIGVKWDAHPQVVHISDPDSLEPALLWSHLFTGLVFSSTGRDAFQRCAMQGTPFDGSESC